MGKQKNTSIQKSLSGILSICIAVLSIIGTIVGTTYFLASEINKRPTNNEIRENLKTSIQAEIGVYEIKQLKAINEINNKITLLKIKLNELARRNKGVEQLEFGAIDDSLNKIIREIADIINSDTFYFDEIALLDSLKKIKPQQNNKIYTPPEISPLRTGIAKIGNEVKIKATIFDKDSDIRYAKLFYRKGGDRLYHVSSLNESDGFFSQIIPSNFVTNTGVEYFIEAKDREGLLARSPKTGNYSIRVHIPKPGEEIKIGDGDSLVSKYKLVSIPLDLDNSESTKIAMDNFEFKDGFPKEFNNFSNISTGNSYFVIVDNPQKTLHTGAGTTISTSTPYTITLNRGWNFIGNPFNFQVPIQNLKLKNSQTSLSPFSLNTYHNTWITLSDSSYIKPFEGYALFSEFSDTLTIDPDVSVSPKGDDKKQIIWNINIHAKTDNYEDRNTYAVVRKSASSGFDIYDVPEPPPIGEYVSVYFPHPEWKKSTYSYTIDTRPEPTEGDLWEFEVLSTSDKMVTLTFNGITNIPKDFQIWLRDITNQIAINLRDNNMFSLLSFGKDLPIRLQLVIGKSNFINDNVDKYFSKPVAFVLNQNYPNPFNPSTTIRFSLPQDERVTLKIVALNGRKIATLINDKFMQAGYHFAMWNGKNDAGKDVASGAYIYQIQAGENVANKKCILLK